MARKRIYTPRIKIYEVETIVAQLRAQGEFDQSLGIIRLFGKYLDVTRIREATEVFKKMIETK